MVVDVDVSHLSHGSLAALGQWSLMADVRDAHNLEFQMDPPTPPIPQLCDEDMCCTMHRHNQAVTDRTPTHGGLCCFSSAGGGRTSSQPSPLPSPPSSQISSDDDPIKLDDPSPAHFSFQPSSPPSHFDFLPASHDLPLRQPKRRRAVSDVDGPHTAQLSCKKRRLRTQLITSRLSQPFSQPATHIINRDAVAAGDKRFIKLAASASATKRCPSTQSSIVRRAAVMNMVRLRVRGEVSGRGNVFMPGTTAAVQAQAAWMQREQQSGTGGRFLAISVPGAGQPGARQPSNRIIMIRAGVSADAPTQGQARTCLPPVPSALRAVETFVGRNAAAPAVRPGRSPVLGPMDAGVEEVGADEEMAFPEDMGRYGSGDDDEDDNGDVYSDFGAIFGGPREGDFSDDDEHSYEECLDELDGISWVGR
ncbi:hypothetical protein ACHAQH_003305 [Verticillium albo-atrum]